MSLYHGWVKAGGRVTNIEAHSIALSASNRPGGSVNDNCSLSFYPVNLNADCSVSLMLFMAFVAVRACP